MKKVFIILIASSLAVACGNGGSSEAKKDSAASTTTPAASTTSSANEKGLELIGSSDCTTCHRLDKNSSGAAIGPAYSEVAARYAPAADTTVDRLISKIISGGTGNWGQVPMTPHNMLSKDTVKQMVEYILSLKK
ncbi:MAG TPA: c-type cytochrome [Puia sp.]|nr:c-type cytochrome [Puia sp.]